eukprot:6280633-Pyramimonas_sp.AAC.1
MAGLSLGLLLAVRGFSLVCWFSPRARPSWCRTGAPPRAGDGGGPQRAPIEGSSEPAAKLKTRKRDRRRTVATQGQVKYTWWATSPRFQPLGPREQGVRSE